MARLSSFCVSGTTMRAQVAAPNNSFKPTPLRSGKTVAKKSLPLFYLHYASPLNSGVMRGTQKSFSCVGKASLNLVPNVDSAVILARPVLDL